MTPSTAAGSSYLDPRVRRAASAFMRDEERRRLRLYRMQLQASVGGMNALAFRMAAASGFGAADVARRLRPPPDWPWRTSRRYTSSHRLMAFAIGHRRATTMASLYAKTSRLRCANGALPRAVRATFRVDGPCIEAEATLGPALVETSGDRAILELPDGIPDTVLTALPGRPVEVLFDHPLLVGAGYVVEKAEHAHWASICVTIVTGVVPVAMPWPHLLRDLEP